MPVHEEENWFIWMRKQVGGNLSAPTSIFWEGKNPPKGLFSLNEAGLECWPRQELLSRAEVCEARLIELGDIVGMDTSYMVKVIRRASCWNEVPIRPDNDTIIIPPDIHKPDNDDDWIMPVK